MQDTIPDQKSDTGGKTEIRLKETKLDRKDYARKLAESQKVVDHPGIHPGLLEFLESYQTVLTSVYTYFQSASESELAISYAAEWILDNIYIVRQAIRLIGEDLPERYYRQLPKMENGPFRGYPRVYVLAREILARDRLNLRIDRLRSFLRAYQEGSPLTMGEIWAIPIMLRLVIIESIVMAAARTTRVWSAEKHPLPLPDYPEQLSDDDVIAQSIIGLRFLGTQDWKEFFEAISLVDKVLSKDPANIYLSMDFETRDAYRKVIEDIALELGEEERDIAQKAIQLSVSAFERWKTGLQTEKTRPSTGVPAISTKKVKRTAFPGFSFPRETHVGYYLVDRGRTVLEKGFEGQISWRNRLEKWVFAHPTGIYLGSIFLLTALFGLFLLGYAWLSGGTIGQLIGVGLLAVFPALTVAVNLLNWIITNQVEPRVLSKMDFSEGLPSDCATMVVIPALLSDLDEVHSLIRQLELQYIRNSDALLFFALLTDFTDAQEERMPGDEHLLEEARRGIQNLNETHRRAGPGPFYLFHRARRWNPKEERWMGWERKRGKLHQFNRLILTGEDHSFSVMLGDLEILPRIRYVITLDADTILPGGSANRLVGTMAHPLNLAEFDPRTGEVISGYTVLQPRTEIHPASANQSLFTRVFAGDTGLDLYTLAVSDVYQDLFGEGAYVGKGIYDVAAFERSLEGRMPENALLSHDLFEGIHGRAGLVTDIVVIEDYPPHYFVYVLRAHRWARGDWQLLPWLSPRVPGAQGEKIRNRLSIISRWKILDNLLRSLVAPFLFFFFISGWFWLPGSPVFWTLVGVSSLAVPLITGVLTALSQIIFGKPIRQALLPIRDGAVRLLLALAFLPFEAMLMLDAISTTLYRLFITRKHLLLWTTAAQTSRLFGEKLHRGVTRKEMFTAFVVSALVAVLIWLVNPEILPIAGPLLLAWLFSPEIAYLISRPTRFQPTPLKPEQLQRLRVIGRRTWLFFERFVGPEDRWLAPDHYQESPLGTVAHRTSPTNIGLAITSTQAAFDLGYIGMLDKAARLRSILENMNHLERYRGHFLNWYNTRNLNPLPPRYVSTVDSGNLAACLIALKSGCLEMAETSILRWESWEGLLDLIYLLEGLMAELEKTDAKRISADLLVFLGQVRTEIAAAKDHPPRWVTLMEKVSGEVLEELEHKLLVLVESAQAALQPEQLRQMRIINQRFRFHLENLQRENKMLLPWLSMLAENPNDGVPEIFISPHAPPAIASAWQNFRSLFSWQPRLGEVGSIVEASRKQLSKLRDLLEDEEHSPELVGQACEWIDRFDLDLESARMAASVLEIGYQDIARMAENFFQEMDFSFLFNKKRQVFHIGYNCSMEKLDNNYYDLLASEARIASLIAVAKGDVPQSHWVHLARPFTQVDGTRALLSWSATMFEYLMPMLFQHSIDGTLLHQSSLAAVEHQIAYAERHQIPWGISESGYYRFDANQFYQYRAFGVPGLGYKRGLGEDRVVAPYASLLALPLRPQAVMKNIDHLQEYGMIGTFGFYEAIDFTPSRLSLGEEYKIVRSYMAHHQGMILASIANTLKDNIMVRRFHTDPRIQSVELLLQEIVPGDVPVEFPHVGDGRVVLRVETKVVAEPWRVRVQTDQPRGHILANGRYGLWITSSGSGYSRWKEFDLTRWRADSTLNDWGTWIYIQDLDNGIPERPAYWSVTYQPTGKSPGSRDVYFDAHMATFNRRDGDISVSTEVTVPPDDDIEIRRITITNHSERERHLRVASYGEVVLAPHEADQRHPLFTKIFISSEWLPDLNALLFRRRPKSHAEPQLFLAHALVLEPGLETSGAHESDRERFLGRGRTARSPRVVEADEQSWLSGTVGPTLDPIMSIGQELDLPPFGSTQLAYLTMAADTRQDVIDAAERYQAWHLIERAFDQSRSQAELELRQLGVTIKQLENFQKILSVLVYPHASLRADPTRLAANQKGQPGLWGFGISGDLPILLVKVRAQEELSLVLELLQAHAYWRNRGLRIDLIILNMQATDYGQELTNQLRRLMERTNSELWLNRRGGIFLVNSDQLGETDQILLESAARVILIGEEGSLENQLKALDRLPQRLPPFYHAFAEEDLMEQFPPISRPQDLQFDNSLGGFSSDGREYVLYLEPGQCTPSPWINVVANPEFGFLVSESGGGFTWSLNSGENRLSTWSNDPVSDTPGEVLYIRDEETAQIWTTTPLPAGAQTPYLVRHGAGYTVFEHVSHGMKTQQTVFIAPDAPVKIIRLRLENLRSRIRRITATYYIDWVLATSRENSQQFIIPEFHHEAQAILARNPYNHEFGERVAFLSASHTLHGLTADRTEFLGRMGSYARPAALGRIGLSSTVVPGADPCGAVQLHLDLHPGEVQEVYFLLGQGEDRETAIQLVRRFQDPDRVDAAWDDTQRLWDDILGTVQVQTPEPAMNLLLNRWLLYQALACRIWGRSAFYQSSGAYGFRDQLQDVMCLVFSRPDLAREHLLRAARHQFDAGDVLHWWHPPSGRGVRTRYSDDLLWLPYATAHYVCATGDESVLSERIPFLTGPTLEPGEKERYGYYASTHEAYPLYEHCRRALEKGTTSGPHDLPLMGGGDWNDGMNKVGGGGRGESVWLGWFLYDNLIRFAKVSENWGDEDHADLYRSRARRLHQALEKHGWDGEWYLRAFYDDGTPLGSARNRECQIDSLSQSWAILTGAGESERAKQAMQAVHDRLVVPEDGLMLLFTPPFDQTPRDPGYIKGYLPGIRENGGQYTHAALWAIWAYVELGQGELAEKLFRMINPVYHADTQEKVQRYRVEPYVIAADVYSVPPHNGRGGWTWYTGSSGWMYRLGVEAILGLGREGKFIRIDPCIPAGWSGYQLIYNYRGTRYSIQVENPDRICRGVSQVLLDGEPIEDGRIPLEENRGNRQIQVILGGQRNNHESD
jgi:cyclic beta-1,2-glucan synthetase